MPTPVSLSQLTDLALGTPEVGAVNFNVLHTLLHAIISKLKIQDAKAEIDDSDKDFLSRRHVSLSGLQSDKDSGRGEDSEDAMSEKSAVQPRKKKVPYHQLELRVEELAEKIEQLNALPSSTELYGQATGKGDSTGRPVADMWQGLQLKRRVDANEEGINKLCSLIEDMMKEIQTLKDTSADLLKKYNSINLDDLSKRLDELALKNEELNAKFATLPTPEEFGLFVTWPNLEDALRGVRDSLEALSQPQERVVIDMSSQTEVASRSMSFPQTHTDARKKVLPKQVPRRASDPKTASDSKKQVLASQISQKNSDGVEAMSSDSSLQSVPGRFTGKSREMLEDLGNDDLSTSSQRVRSDSGELQGKRLSSDTSATGLRRSSAEMSKGSTSDSRKPAHVTFNAWNKLNEKSPTVQLQPSRPSSSRPSTRQSSAGGPSAELLDMLERLGKLTEDHELLTQRVDVIEEELKKKADKDDLKELGVSSELWAELQKMKDEMQRIKEMSQKAFDRLDELEELVKQLASKMDAQSLGRAQQAILQLQKELDRLHATTESILEENQERAKDIENLLALCNRLQETKADKEFVTREVDVKADKRQLDGKVNHNLFDTTTNEINNMIKDILSQLAGHEEEWKRVYGQLSDDIDTKLDRLELDPLKEWLEARLKALSKKIQQTASSTEWGDDDAAGLRKQLLQRFNCLSCDRPVDMMTHGPVPSIPQPAGLPATRSPRPYTTFELDQIRQHAKNPVGKLPLVNSVNMTFEERVRGMRGHELRAFLVHFGLGEFANQDLTDYYATIRQCGGSHTLTYPHKRTTKLSHLSNLFKDEETVQPAEQPYPIYKEEVDVQGVDGHIYKGRVERVQLEAKLPSTMTGTSQTNISRKAGGDSPPGSYPQPPPRGVASPRPLSRNGTRMTQRPTSKTGMRPTSARQSTERSMVQQLEEFGEPEEEPVVIPQEESVAPPPTELAEDGTTTELQGEEGEGEGEGDAPAST